MNLAIFDIDGTLVRSDAHEDRLYWHALEDVLGVAREPFDWASFPHVTDNGIAHDVVRRQTGTAPTADALKATEDHFAEMWREALAEMPAHEVEVPGAGAWMRELTAHDGWRVAIATGGWRQSATAKMTAAGIDAAALPMACANDALSREEIVTTARRRAEDAHGVAAFERVVYVGDGVWDVRTCAALEMPLVGMAVTAKVRERLTTLGVSHVLDDYRDVAAVLVALETAEVPG